MRDAFELQYCAVMSFKSPDTLFARCESGAYVAVDVELQWQWWQAACASKQAEVDSWKAVAESWRENAVEWSRRNAELIAATQEVLRISDRKHNAWDRAYAIISKNKGE